MSLFYLCVLFEDPVPVLMIPNRICIITILRIVSFANMNLQDCPFSEVNDVIWSELEPCLGIFNACLPVLPPVMSHLLRPAIAKWKIWSGSKSTAPGTRTLPSFVRPGLRRDYSEARKSRRVGDIYPLPSVSSRGQSHADSVAHATRPEVRLYKPESQSEPV